VRKIGRECNCELAHFPPWAKMRAQSVAKLSPSADLTGQFKADETTQPTNPMIAIGEI
jgi:hypothetical protein